MKTEIYLSGDQMRSDALRNTLERWHASDPSRMAFALVPEAEQACVSLLQNECLRAGVPLAGAVFPALIQENRFVTSGVWLLSPALGSGRFLINDLDSNAMLCAHRIAAAVRPQLGARKMTLFMVFDSMVSHISSILDELYLELGDAVNYLGVNAGSESFQPLDCLFDNYMLVGNAVLCLLIPEFEAALAHGYASPEEVVSVTASVGNRITHIDWRPAFEVYREQIKQIYAIELTRENFYQYAVHFPFGIALATGETLVRIPVGVAPDGAIHCVGEVPEYAMLTLLQGPVPGATDVLEKIASHLASPGPEALLLGFYCAGRRMHLGNAAEQELLHLAQRTGMAIGGALSLGEIGSIERGAYPYFHNGALVCAHWTAI